MGIWALLARSAEETFLDKFGPKNLDFGSMGRKPRGGWSGTPPPYYPPLLGLPIEAYPTPPYRCLRPPGGATITRAKVNQSLAPKSKSVTIPPGGGLPKVILGKMTKTCGEKEKKRPK